MSEVTFSYMFVALKFTCIIFRYGNVFNKFLLYFFLISQKMLRVLIGDVSKRHF